MTILRMSIFVLSFALCASAYSQTGSPSTYQCSSGTSLKDGFLIYKTGSVQAAAKHKDGTVSEISGIFGNFQPNAGFLELEDIRPLTYAEINQVTVALNQFMANTNPALQNGQMSSGGLGTGMGMGMGMGIGGGVTAGFPGATQGAYPGGFPGGMGMAGGMSGRVNNAAQPASAPQAVMGEEPPDRDDIETTPTRYVEGRPGDNPGFRPGDMYGFRPGDAVPPRAGDLAAMKKVGQAAPRRGDQAPAMSEGARKLREPVQHKTGDLVMKRGTISFSARLDSQGNIREISYRDGKRPTGLWRAGARNPASSESVYVRLNSELNNIRARAYCCTQNPGANCGDVLNRGGAQSSLRSEKPSIGQKIQNAWSDMVKAFRSSTSSEAK